MTSSAPGWWLALPLLVLPWWWHRQKRRRLQSQPLATARFLPLAAEQQERIWRWSDRLLLAVRCALLLTLMAWLADLVLPWRGDTVLMDPQVDAAWAESEVQQAGLAHATRLRWCAEATAGGRSATAPAPALASESCDVKGDDPLRWLARHEREWQAGARWLVLARDHDVAMPARPPRLAHTLGLRIQAASPPEWRGARRERHVVLASDRSERWRALFSTFESAGLGQDRYVFSAAPDTRTELVVWDRAGKPDPAWRAPLWWVTSAGDAGAFSELAGAPRWRALRTTESPRGRLWALDHWPLGDARDDEAGARVLYETWQALQPQLQPYAPPSMNLPAGTRGTAGNGATAMGALRPLMEPWLAPLLVALFALERGLAHARRR